MLPKMAIRSGIIRPCGRSAAASACGRTMACGCACGRRPCCRRSPGNSRYFPLSPRSRRAPRPAGITGPQAHAQEVGDQGFDVVHRAVLHRRRGQRMIRFVRTLGHVVHALLDDAQALPHLLDADRRAVITIAVLARWDIELELFVARIGLPLAKVPFQAAGAKIRHRSRPTRWLRRL